MSVLSRVTMAVKAGVAAAWDAWRGDQSETQATRATRYGVLWGYYLNDVYDELINDWAQAYKRARSLYSQIQPLYNPVTRLVDFYVAKVAGGALDPTGRAGALPIQTQGVCDDADPGVVDAILQVWRWSRWGRSKALWVRYGAALGDSVIKVVEDQAARQVAFQVHWPGDVAEADFDRLGQVSYVRFEYQAEERDEENNCRVYTYQEVITPELFSTFKDGKPFDYQAGQENGPACEWANPFGFVPVVIVSHKQGGQNWGLCAYHAGVPKIDQLNDLASHIGDQVRKAVHPQWVSFGTSAGDGLERNDKLWHHPRTDGRVEPLVAPIDISGALAVCQDWLGELERDYPELKISKMASGVGEGWSGRAVALMLEDVRGRVIEARNQYDAALVEADRMALRIGAYRGYWPGGVHDEFEHRIGERVVFETDEEEENKGQGNKGQGNRGQGNKETRKEMEVNGDTGE